MTALQNTIKNKNEGVIWDPVMWQCKNATAIKNSIRHTIKMWMRRRQLSILSAVRCKESHSNRPKQVGSTRCRRHLEVPTQPLCSSPSRFCGDNLDGRCIGAGTQKKKKKKKEIIKETGRRIILFMDLPNLYLMEVNYVENRICSLQCENQIA